MLQFSSDFMTTIGQGERSHKNNGESYDIHMLLQVINAKLTSLFSVEKNECNLIKEIFWASRSAFHLYLLAKPLFLPSSSPPTFDTSRECGIQNFGLRIFCVGVVADSEHLCSRLLFSKFRLEDTGWHASPEMGRH